MEITFRPSLTLSEINTLTAMLQREYSNSHDLQTGMLLNKIQKFVLRANAGVVQGNIRTESVATSLGFSAPAISLQAQKENAYVKWKDNPLMCTPKELLWADEWRFAQGYMNEEEEAEMNRKLMEEFNKKDA